MKYPWFKAKNFTKDYIREISKITKSKKMTMGSRSLELEDKLKKYLKVKHVVLTPSGTSALMMASLALNVTKNDTVIVNNFTWVATSNPAKILGANIKLVDTKKNSQMIDFNELNSKIVKYKPKLVFLVHMNGEPNYNKEFEKLKKKYKFFVIEDAAQAIFSKHESKICGTKYDIGCYSLGITKTLNMIYGGLCCTNSDKIAKKLRTIQSNGLSSIEWYLKNEIATDTGLNFKVSDLHSAVGLINLKNIDILKKENKQIYNFYKDNIKNDKIRFMKIEGKFSIPCWPQVLVDNKKNFEKYCSVNNIGYHPGMRCLSESLPLKEADVKYPNSIYVSKHAARLPSGPGYSISDIKKITKIINNY